MRKLSGKEPRLLNCYQSMQNCNTAEGFIRAPRVFNFHASISERHGNNIDTEYFLTQYLFCFHRNAYLGFLPKILNFIWIFFFTLIYWAHAHFTTERVKRHRKRFMISFWQYFLNLNLGHAVNKSVQYLHTKL